MPQTFNSQTIETILNDLKTDSLGRIRGKSRAIDKIQSAHLKKLDAELTDIRIFIARHATGHPAMEMWRMIDDFIYKKQIS